VVVCEEITNEESFPGLPPTSYLINENIEITNDKSPLGDLGVAAVVYILISELKE
jgi:hypothetical protein